MCCNRGRTRRRSGQGLIGSLYGGALRPLLPIAASRAVSRAGGAVMSSRLSRGYIGPFIRKNNIDMGDYAARPYKSFNDFFTRELRPGARRVDMEPSALISPCDCRMTAYEIGPGLEFEIKGGLYSVVSLLKNRELAGEFAGGWCLIFRLSVDDYHRYIYFDSGSKGENIPIAGRYYTVQPLALKHGADFFKENSREYSVMETGSFGRAVQVEIGATFVGRVSNLHGRHSFRRGEEKGMFEFGGSTIVLLLKRGAAEVDRDILSRSQTGLETRVLLGQAIGRAPEA